MNFNLNSRFPSYVWEKEENQHHEAQTLQDCLCIQMAKILSCTPPVIQTNARFGNFQAWNIPWLSQRHQECIRKECSILSQIGILLYFSNVAQIIFIVTHGVVTVKMKYRGVPSGEIQELVRMWSLRLGHLPDASINFPCNIESRSSGWCILCQELRIWGETMDGGRIFSGST